MDANTIKATTLVSHYVATGVTDTEFSCRCGHDRMTDDSTIPACGRPYHCPALLAGKAEEQRKLARTANEDKFFEDGSRIRFGIRCF